MSTKTKDAIDRTVRRGFERPDPARVARQTLVYATLTAVLAYAAWSLDGYLAWALWALVAWRASIQLLFLPLASKAIDEKMRRLETLPPEYLRFLRTGQTSSTAAKKQAFVASQAGEPYQWPGKS
jgi:hypothetical protein